MTTPSHSHHDHTGLRREQNRRRLAWALVLAAGYMLAEVAGGLVSNSLALLADAGHMLSDVAALGLSLFALWIAQRRPTSQRTYGYYRAEILAALVNGAALVVVAILIFIEAYRRLHDPPHVQGGLMMGIAVGGLVVNLVGLRILGPGREENLNLRGAWLHVLTDAMGSAGAIVAGLLVWGFGWNWSDPLASVAIGLLVIYSSWRLLAEAVAVLMEGAPPGINVDDVRAAIAAVPEVIDVHDLHVWSITSGMESLSAHVVLSDVHAAPTVLADLRRMLHDRFGVGHITIQIEPEDFQEHGCHP